MIKTQHPFIDDLGNEHDNLIKHWTDDETKTLLQVETGAMYDEAIDIYPCPFTYQEVDKPEPEPEPDPEEDDGEEEGDEPDGEHK